jgi:hypothetical protein
MSAQQPRELTDLVVGGLDHDGEAVVAIAEFDAVSAAMAMQCMFWIPPFCLGPPILLCNLCCGCYWITKKNIEKTQAWITPKYLKIDKSFCGSSQVRIPLDKIQNVNLASG